MKRVIVSALAIGTVVLLLSCATRNAAQTADGPFYDAAVTAAGSVSDPWPLVFISGANTYTVFEPQCDSWDGRQFVGRSAVAVQPYGQAQPTYGVLGFSAITLVNKTTRTVTLADVKSRARIFLPPTVKCKIMQRRCARFFPNARRHCRWIVWKAV